MRPRYFAFVLAAAATLLLVALSVVYLLPRMHTDVGDTHLRLAMVVVTAFLIITLLRYFILLWLGYLHHVETKTAAS